MAFTPNEQTLFEQQAVTTLVLSAIVATHPNKAELLSRLESLYEHFVARQLNMTQIGDSAAETARQTFSQYIELLKAATT